jgi:hypothetical protein
VAVADDITTLVAACRRSLFKGTSLSGDELRLCIDTLQYIAGGADGNVVTAPVLALQSALSTMFAAWAGAGTGDSSAVLAAQQAIVDPLTTAAVSAAATEVAPDVYANRDSVLDGRTS